ncbi:MAG: hypothetical protein EGP81_06230 [Bacteroides clarus]|uniref:Uncharacterized protein n=1 Tax=Bacteroides clarus TaxID=626929 RepID=A0A412N753_9BACE|nr:hypothetical protein [Bacteroides clarus]RGT34016.1 hypothetical protein DWX38_06520 [Bacteroides clarus]
MIKFRPGDNPVSLYPVLGFKGGNKGFQPLKQFVSRYGTVCFTTQNISFPPIETFCFYRLKHFVFMRLNTLCRGI